MPFANPRRSSVCAPAPALAEHERDGAVAVDEGAHLRVARPHGCGFVENRVDRVGVLPFDRRCKAPAERDDESGLIDRESDDEDRDLAANDHSRRRSPHQLKPDDRRDAGRQEDQK
ncbi:MAG: hypothetical protein DMG04_15845 [Acidobacteria bacterium]|nr:MAG: hypothetical protein DMG04_15845 [Acidobacteriota bacterium]